ncbi:hypothetical protein LINPERHAP1_LOCUS25776 [Linum perenne]
MLPVDSASMQREMLSGIGETQFGFGSFTGCLSQDFIFGGVAVRVFGTFACGLSVSVCNDCFNAAVQHMQDKCSGNTGAVYSSYQKCCFRYEIYDICSNGGNWRGRCNNNLLNMLPSDSATSQRALLSGFRETQFNSGSIKGCFSSDYSFGGAPVFQVSSIFLCTLTTSECNECFSSAVEQIQIGCPGRAGAVFLSYPRCCLRYELYDICATPECAA